VVLLYFGNKISTPYSNDINRYNGFDAVSLSGGQQEPYASIHIPLTLYPRRGNRHISDIPQETFTFYHNDLTMRNTPDVTDDKPIAVIKS
jgi:hypothetical protein